MNYFDPEKHIYKKMGIRIPGTTDILKAAGFIRDDWFTEDAKWRGKCVHKAIELFNKNLLDWESLDPQIAGYVKSYEAFLEHTKFKVEGSEEPLFADTFGCIPDAWGMLSGKPVVIEFKSGLVPDWAAFQTALQAIALSRDKGFAVQGRIGLQLMADGAIARATPFAEYDEPMALGLVNEFWWKQRRAYSPGWGKE